MSAYCRAPQRHRAAFAASLLFIFCINLPAAIDIPENPGGYVYDGARFMNSRQVQQLDTQLRQFENQTSNQVVVATFPSLENESLEEVSMRIFEKWHLGQKGKSNGILLSVWRAERKVRIEVGYGLEPVLTDALSGRIIRDEMAPAFRKGDYYGGIIMGVRAIVKATQGEYQGKQRRSKRDRSGGIAGLIFPLLFFFLLFGRRRGALGGFLLGSMLGAGLGGRRGGFGGGGGFGGFSGGGGFGGGGGASGGW